MPKVIAREGEAFQVTLRKFKKSCEKAGLLSDIKKNNYYEKPSVERR
ncbi:MAG: 30S ribosomal protein S21, partial [Candidatus Cloacimonadota bacterium]